MTRAPFAVATPKTLGDVVRLIRPLIRCTDDGADFSQGRMIKPTGSRVLIERLDGDGREEVRPSGIIMPARDLSIRQSNTWRVPDTYRAVVIAVGPKAEHELAEGVEVVVHTYDQRAGGAKLAGVQVDPGSQRLDDIRGERRIVEIDDILVAIERPIDFARVRTAMMKILKSDVAKVAMGIRDFTEAEYEAAPLFGMIPKTKEWSDEGVTRTVDPERLSGQKFIPKPPESVRDLGFHRAADVDDAHDGDSLE